HTRAALEDDLPAEAGARVETVTLEELLGLLALGPRERELVPEHATGGAAGDAYDDQKSDPCREHAPAAAVTEAGQGAPHTGEVCVSGGGLGLLTAPPDPARPPDSSDPVDRGFPL